jgi:hypothetical protein
MTPATTKILRVTTVVSFALTSAILVFAAFSAGWWRDAYVFAPRIHAVEAAMSDLVESQRKVKEETGSFSAIGSEMAGKSATMRAEVDSVFLFDSAPLETGGLRLRAIPRPQAVENLQVPGRMLINELSAAGKVIRSEWLPGSSSSVQ